MKKSIFLMLALLFFTTLETQVSAHPGKRDSNGGHTCRTNCAKYGLEDGEYHYHGGANANSNSDNNENANNGTSELDKSLQDREKGEEAGEKAGYTAGYNGQERDSATTGTDSYIRGFKSTYNTGFEEGTKKLEEDSKVAQKEGAKLGESQKPLVVPDKYKSNKALNKDFTDGYNNGVKSYYIKLGHAAAFTTITYIAPELEKEEYVQWYKEGFNSNDEVEKIKEEALELGNSGEEYKVPESYSHAEPVFKHYYEKGIKEKEESDTATATILVFGAIGWLGRRFYVAKKMLK